MSIIIVLTILQTLQLPVFNAVKPYLFTTHMLGWKGFFDVKMDEQNQQILGSIENLPAVMRSAGYLALHIICFWGMSVFVFRKKDIVS
jgi:ABC-2 type transport system permease protein